MKDKHETYKAEVVPVEIAAVSGSDRYTFRGVASTTGNVDRMGRVFLPGAFGTKAVKVPLLLNHDEASVIGSSVLTPQNGQLIHESSLNPKVAKTAEVRALIEDGDIMSTSISWVANDDTRFYGWTHLARAQPEMAKQAAGLGIPQAENVVYFAKANLVENSVVPIPANDQALIGASALLGTERGMVESMREVAKLATAARATAAGARNSQRDQSALQRAHDALVEAGAFCPLTPGADALETPGEPGEPDMTGIKGGFKDDIRTPMGASVPMADDFDAIERQLAELQARH